MTSITRKNTNRYYYICILSCFIIGYSLLLTIFIRKNSQVPISLSVSLGNETIDYQDEWKYQNSITGEWYYWRIVYKKYKNDKKWDVK
jgi:hypothetical protein